MAAQPKSRLKRVFEAMFGKGRLAALLLLTLFIALKAMDPSALEMLRLKTFDAFQNFKPREITQRPVTIVDLDEASLREIGQWPWPRTVVAKMVQNLMGMGAVLVAFDVVFPETDRASPDKIAGTLVGLDDALREKLKSLPGNDAVLGEVIRKSRVVLGQAGFWEKNEQAVDRPPVKKSVAVMGPNPQAYLPKFESLIRNVPEIEKFAAGHGIFSLQTEPDGIVRRVPTLFSYEGNLYPALSVEMLRVATGRKTILVKTTELGIDSVAIAKGLSVPTDERGRAWPYFSGHDKEKYVSAKDVLSGKAPVDKIRNKLIVVGTSAVGLLDIRATPTERVMPGVEVHAQLIEAILTNEYLSRPAYIIGAEIVLML
ncbi:MAG: CHASE2 domain-containing protein, partial [Rhodospirillales bacterium]|nr:CHASE2 domain-containing protein [Rhodospirillales bacterium]